VRPYRTLEQTDTRSTLRRTVLVGASGLFDRLAGEVEVENSHLAQEVQSIVIVVDLADLLSLKVKELHPGNVDMLIGGWIATINFCLVTH
jgi:hypothetical protein